ncbi:MAG: DNA polymerase III subunit delta' [Armatimonadota bacterium]|nr:DNA polymerase III subunit delta' [Armatimonadota bacterium]
MTFRDVVNQDHAIMLLRGAVRSDKVGHAYLLVGPGGVGRRLVALAFAQLLNCAHADGDACGECTACRKIADGNHPDVRVLDISRGLYIEAPGKDYKGKEIPVDQIRALRQEASYPPYEGRWKVFIVADAERMNPNSANSLLKILEEPPARVVFVLIAESSVALLPTIVSRCQLVRCSYLRTDEIERALTERWNVPRERARLLAILADGRLGRALEWAASEDRLEARNRLLDLLPALETGDPLVKLDAAETFAKQTDVLPDLLDLAVLWYRDLLVWKQLREPGLLTNADRQAQIAELAGRYTEAMLGARIEAIEAAKESLRRNVNPRLALEKLFLSFGDTVTAPSA